MATPSVSSNVSGIVDAAAAGIPTTRDVRFLVAGPLDVEHSVLFASANIYGTVRARSRLVLPASPRRLRLGPRGHPSRASGSSEPDFEEGRQDKGVVPNGRKRWIGIMIFGDKDNGAGVT